MSRDPWLDTHVHVSDMGADGRHRPRLLEDLVDVLDRCDADLVWVISPDANWNARVMKDAEGMEAALDFIHDLARRSGGRLLGSCLVNPHFADASLRVMEKAFAQRGFVLLGEMLQYMMDYRMDSAPVERIVRAAAQADVPVQVHISTSNSKQGNFSSGVEELEDLLALVERVPQATYILAHLVGMPKDDPPVVDVYLDVIEKRLGKWPDNFWAEIRDFSSPGVRSALARIPHSRLIAGTDWVTRVGPPFLPYGTLFPVRSVAENPYPPSVASMKSLMKKWGAADRTVSAVAFENAARLLKIRRSA